MAADDVYHMYLFISAVSGSAIHLEGTLICINELRWELAGLTIVCQFTRFFCLLV